MTNITHLLIRFARKRLLSAGIMLCALASITVCVATAPTAGASDKDSPRTPAPATDNLDYWLSRSKSVASQPASPAKIAQPQTDTRQTFIAPDGCLPGVVEMSDGQLHTGWLGTTPGKPWILWVPAEKRWRRIPLAAVLRIRAVVLEEKMALKWRWKGMGQAERTYSGKKFPTRRTMWEFTLADGAAITGEIKGQPLWIHTRQGRIGPLVLHERSKGEPGESLADLIYVKQAIVSRRLYDSVREFFLARKNSRTQSR